MLLVAYRLSYVCMTTTRCKKQKRGESGAAPLSWPSHELEVPWRHLGRPPTCCLSLEACERSLCQDAPVALALPVIPCIQARKRTTGAALLAILLYLWCHVGCLVHLAPTPVCESGVFSSTTS